MTSPDLSAEASPSAQATAGATTDQAHVATQVHAAQVRAMHEVIPLAQLASLACGIAVTAVLWRRVDLAPLLSWLGLRALVSLTRIWYSHACQRNPGLHTDRTYVAMALVDGVVWGALGWWLTPFSDLEVAIVTICVAVTAACIGVIMLHIHPTSNWIFVAPILVPNALYSLQRNDDLGLFCCVGFLGLTALLIFEGERLNRRSLALLRLRFESEQAHLAEKRALHQLEQLLEKRSRFVATISHEMRTPLHGMLGLLRVIKEHADQPPNPRHLELMAGSGRHLINVINEVLDYSRLESTGLPIATEAFRLDTLLHELADSMRINCEGKGLTLSVACDLPSPCWVLGDETRVRQVLLNLLGNAMKFTAAGGVCLSAQRDLRTGHTRLSVRDTGLGIPQDELARIFEPFHQAEGTYERRFGGSGLGLTIARELCRAMGGELGCQSQPGTGSVFTCELPLASTMAPTPESEQRPGQPVASDAITEACAQKTHVLVVDDNPVNNIVAQAELQHLGVAVSIAESAQEALAWLAQHQPDLVLMDCEMPIMDGVAATREIRARETKNGLPPVPIIALTANGREAYDQRCQQAGMNDYLGKPFDRSDLKAILARHTGRTRTTSKHIEAALT